MAYTLEDINYRTIADPKGMIEEADAQYNKKVERAARLILENKEYSPIILVSGPSGSGKTTSAIKISEALERHGVRTYYVAMDDYYMTIQPETVPRTPEGEMDLESPLCLDLEMMNRHFTELSEGKRIFIPKYDFCRQMRTQEPSKSIKLKKDEMVVYEGIHALNDLITNVHPEAFKLYISARSDVTFQGKKVFDRSWFRLVRRTVRDYLFRGAQPSQTIAMWANVCRGETQYIAPYKDKANYQFDTSFNYELPVLNKTATQLFQTIPEGIERYDELKKVFPALLLFGDIDESLVAEDALIREFIGGGVYEY
ncbi:MAG: nucleoside kinase [Candidatus Limivicinus sp.]|jgi:uridine kinase